MQLLSDLVLLRLLAQGESTCSCSLYNSWRTVDLHNGIRVIPDAAKHFRDIISVISLLPQIPVRGLITQELIQAVVDGCLVCLGQGDLVLILTR